MHTETEQFSIEATEENLNLIAPAFMDLIEFAASQVKARKLTKKELWALVISTGVPSLQLLANRPDLIPQVKSAIEAQALKNEWDLVTGFVESCEFAWLDHPKDGLITVGRFLDFCKTNELHPSRTASLLCAVMELGEDPTETLEILNAQDWDDPESKSDPSQKSN